MYTDQKDILLASAGTFNPMNTFSMYIRNLPSVHTKHSSHTWYVPSLSVLHLYSTGASCTGSLSVALGYVMAAEYGDRSALLLAKMAHNKYGAIQVKGAINTPDSFGSDIFMRRARHHLPHSDCICIHSSPSITLWGKQSVNWVEPTVFGVHVGFYPYTTHLHSTNAIDDILL